MKTSREGRVVGAVFFIIIICTIYLGCFLWIGTYGAFWSEDAGVKFLQVVNLVRSGWMDGSLDYPGAELDPGFSFNPLYGNHTHLEEGKIYSIYPPAFPFLSSFLYAVFGFPGLYLLPLLSTMALLVVLYRLSARHFGVRHAVMTTAVTAFATPLFFHAFTFWEINVAAFLLCAGCSLMRKGGRWRRMAPAGILMGCAVFFREESVLFTGAVIGALFLAREYRRRARAAALGAGFPVVGYVAGELLGGGTGMAHFFHNIATRPEQFGTWSNLLRYKSLLVYQLLFSGHPRVPVSLTLLIPTMALLLALCVARWRLTHGVGDAALPHRGISRGNEFFLIVFLAGMGIAYFIYFSLMPEGGHPIRLSPFTSGLFLFSPWIVVTLCTPEPRRGMDAALFRGAAGFVLFFCCAVPTSGGLQWGPRYLVIAYPFLAVSACASFLEWRRLVRCKKVFTALFAFLIAASVVHEFYGLSLLKAKKVFNRRCMDVITAAETGTVITLPWWVPLGMAPVFYEKTFFTARNPRLLDTLVALLRRERREGFLLVAENNPALISIVEERCGMRPMDVEHVSLPADNFFQLLFLHYDIGDKEAAVSDRN